MTLGPALESGTESRMNHEGCLYRSDHRPGAVVSGTSVYGNIASLIKIRRAYQMTCKIFFKAPNIDHDTKNTHA